jgi:hypothetical protein
MPKTVFISYSRHDYSFAERLVDDLLAHGISAWLDQYDIKAGQKWDSAVQEALSTSDYLLVILTPNSAASENVLDEVAYAINRKKPVFPVLYRDCDIPFRLARIQYIDFRSDYEGGLRSLLDELRERGVPVQVHAPGDQESRPSEHARSSEPVSKGKPIYSPFHALLHERRTPVEVYEEGIVLRGSVYINGQGPPENFHLQGGSLLITDVSIDNRQAVEGLLHQVEPYFEHLGSKGKTDFVIIAPSISKSVIDYFGAWRKSTRICSIAIGAVTEHMKMVLQDLAIVTGTMVISRDVRGELVRELDNGILVIDASKALFEVSAADLGSFQEITGGPDHLMFRADPSVSEGNFQGRWTQMEAMLENTEYNADYIFTLDRMIRLAGTVGEDCTQWIGSKRVEELSIDFKDIDDLPIFHPPVFKLESAGSLFLGRGYASPYMITDPDRLSAEVDHPVLLLFAGHLDVEPLIPFINSPSKGLREGLTIISYTASDSLMATLNLNKLRGIMNPLLITLEPVTNETHQSLQALADRVGTRVIDNVADLASLPLDELGAADHISSTHYETVIMIS